jgi:uncharacterized protein YbjT (DUF2867 family)
MTPAETDSYLVVGATGKTGGRVASRLAAAATVREASRRGAIRFDWSEPGTYAAAVEGVLGMFLTVAGQDPDNPARVAELLATAARSDVERVVLLSARAVEFHPDGALAAVEEVVRTGPLAHTILRPSWFAQNFTEGFLAPDADGRVTAPTGEGREPFIDLDDLADVAVAALTDDRGHDTVNVSGSESLNFGEAVELLAQSTGRSARFIAADPDAYRAQIALTMPAEYVAWRMAMFDAIRDGRDAYRSDGVERLLGRPARGFSEWVAAEAGRAASQRS